MSETVMRVAGTGSQPLPRKVAFTQSWVERATCPAGKGRAWAYDTKQPGLALLVTEGGSKSFYVCKRLKGAWKRYRLADFPELSVEAARTLARADVGDIAKGVDPQATRKASKVKGLTLGGLWTWFLNDHAKLRKRSWRSDEIRYNLHLKPWASKRLDDITQPEVTALHHKVAKATSKATANRVLALLNTMVNKASQLGWNGPNPCKGVQKFTEASRERYLQPGEIGAFLAALDAPETHDDWRDFFSLCLYTGARRSNTLSMRWAELDIDAGRWSIPGEKFKNGKAMTCYLPAPAVEILQRRKGKVKGEWVFPSGISKAGHLVKPENAWADVVKRAGLTDLHVHDLRRSLGSWQATGGTSLAIIGKSLGHRSLQATAIYARMQIDPVKASVDAATTAMLSAAEASKGKPATPPAPAT